MNTPSLDELREQIDQLDARLQQLIDERARLAQQVARIKQAGGADPAYYRPAREAAVLRAVKARNQGPLDDATMLRLFRELMSVCLALESRLKVAYLGPRGTFTEAAALKHFGHSVDACPHPTIDMVFREVESGAAHHGVVPVENSTEGAVTHTLDRLLRSPLTICGEVVLAVHHCLLSREPDISAVRRVRAHQQSLAQCRSWLDTRLAGCEQEAVSSNGEAARLAATQDGAAAIASRQAAEVYDLKVLAENIEDEPSNTTRFLVLGREPVGVTGEDKSVLLLATGNESGALHRLLAPFAEHGVGLSRIESRPSRRSPWDYNFFVDMEGHADDPALRPMLAAVNQQASLFRVLGAYPVPVL